MGCKGIGSRLKGVFRVGFRSSKLKSSAVSPYQPYQNRIGHTVLKPMSLRVLLNGLAAQSSWPQGAKYVSRFLDSKSKAQLSMLRLRIGSLKIEPPPHNT